MSWDTPGLGFALLRYIRGSWVSGVLLVPRPRLANFSQLQQSQQPPRVPPLTSLQLSMGLSLIHVGIVLHDLLLSATLEEVRITLSLYVGAHSSIAAQFMFWRRLHHVQEGLRLASLVAAHLEPGAAEPAAVRSISIAERARPSDTLTGEGMFRIDGPPSSPYRARLIWLALALLQARMASAAKLILRIKHSYATFSVGITLSVALTLFTGVPWLHSPSTFAKVSAVTPTPPFSSPREQAQRCSATRNRRVCVCVSVGVDDVRHHVLRDGLLRRAAAAAGRERGPRRALP